MSPIRTIGPKLANHAKIWGPLALWLALWLSISPGRVQDAFDPGRFTDFVNGIRALLPFIAGGVGGIVLAVMAYKRRTDSSLFIGPLGFVFIYAVVGLFATTLSPDKSQAIYGVGIYISVPLVLWAIASGHDPLEKVRRTVDITWLAMVVLAASLLAIAFFKLDLGDAILHPKVLERCQFGPAWFDDTSGVLRSTGVGRYAAVAALVAIAGIFHGRWRTLWGLALIAALLVLFSSGARTAFVAFSGASALMVVFYGGKKAIVIGSLVALIVLPVLLITGAHETVVDHCLRRSFQAAESSLVLAPTTLSIAQPGQTSGSNSPENDPASAQAPQADESTYVAIPILDGVNSTADELPLVSFSGRSEVWREGLKLTKESPLLGYGFNADRIILQAHIHNAFIHSLIQTGALGTLPLVAGIALAWWLLLKAVRHLHHFSKRHRTRIVLAGGMLTFFSIRSLAESSGAFFGIDWLLLAPVLLYLSVVNHSGEAEVAQSN